MTIAGLVDQALRAAGVPIVGVSIGDPNDRATWRAIFDDSASDAQKAQGASLINAVDVSASVQGDADAQSAVDNKAVKAAVLTSLRGRLGRNPTPAEIAAERAVYVAIYKTL